MTLMINKCFITNIKNHNDMKKTKILTLIISAVLFTLASCKPIDDPQQLTKGVTVTTADPTHVSGTTAICGAEVTADDAGLLLELGVCWSKTEKPTIDDLSSKTFRCSQPYQCFITNLEPNTKYHVRGYAKYGTEYCYGDEKTFTTLADTTGSFPGLLTTTPAYNISAYDFTSGGTLSDTDISLVDFNFHHFGICVSQAPNPTINDCEFYVSEPIYYFSNPFQLLVSGLYPNTQYYYRAFMAYGDYDHYDYVYGDVLTLTTPEVPFILNLETYNVYFSGYDYMVAYGRVECNQPEQIDQVGFCYSTTNEYPQYDSDLYTTVATPTGEWFEFNSHIYDVSANKKYYVRSYARYMTDSIKYGNVVSIDTY